MFKVVGIKHTQQHSIDRREMRSTFPSPLFCSMLIGFLWLASFAEAQSLKYALKSGQKFSFEFDITVDGDQQTTTFKGVTNYTVDSASDQQLRLTYRGGLNESVKPKDNNRNLPFGSFGPSGILHGPAFQAMFGRQTFAGKSHTSNKIIIETSGRVLSLEGNSQLPYLLGNLSLLPFERLPSVDLEEWTADSGVSITEDKSDRRFPIGPFGRYGAFGPFGNSDESIQAASEETKYKVKDSNDRETTIVKNYKLSTPQIEGRESFDLSGAGTWTFDSVEHLPQASEMKLVLTVRSGNITVAVPISFRFNRLTEEKLSEMEAESKKRIEENKKIAEENKAKSEAPLTQLEITEILSKLNSGNATLVHPTLMQLSTKTPKESAPEMVAAIKKHIGSKDSFAAHVAERALLNWDSEYKLQKAYEGSSPVDSSNLEITSATPLYVGQIVQVQEHGTFWHAAEITELLPDGKVAIRYRGWGGNRVKTLPRRNIQLAPKGVVQPPKPVAAESLQYKLRTWSDASGGFSIEAVFIGFEKDKIKLRRADGKEVAVPINRLGSADQEHVQKIAEAIKNLDNPFDPK